MESAAVYVWFVPVFCQCFIQPCQQGITLNGLAMWAFTPASNTFLRFPSKPSSFWRYYNGAPRKFQDIGFLPAK